MNQAENDRVERLNRYLDDVSRGFIPAAGAVNLEFAPSVQRLQQLDSTPGPTSAFAARLQRQLAAQTEASVQISRQRVPRQWIRRVDMASAAVLAAAMLVIVIVYSFNDPQREQFNRVAVTSDPTPTMMASLGFSPTPATETGATEAPEPSPTEQVADVASPEPSLTSPAQETAETDIDPPIQAADIPFYDSLEQMLNASDIVVVGQPTGKITEIDANHIYSEFQVDQTLRGAVGTETITLWQLSDLDPGAQYLLFLSRSQWDEEEIYTANITIPPVGLHDGIIVPPEYTGPDYSIAQEYASQPLEALAEDIAAIPEIEPVIRALVTKYGWEPVGKGYLRPVDVPGRETFGNTKPLRFSDETWEMALVASQRVGLDFSQYAGQQLQILPYYLERRPANGERAVQAMLLIHEQQIVGAWVVVALESEPFGLDQREQVLQIPVAVPTPEPTPTFPVPSGDAVNPAELYNLADAPYLILCWPYCDETLQTDELREAIVQALDRDLAVEDISAYPTPTQDFSMEQATGDFVDILFWHNTPFQSRSTALGFDRQTSRILLPFDGGWITAPPDLLPLFDGLDIPPPPTKPQ